VYIVEVGAGTGKFAFLFLRKMFSDHANLVPPSVRVKYIVTDFVEKNVEFWARSAHFQYYRDRGLVDFATFDATNSREVCGMQLVTAWWCRESDWFVARQCS
jgi:hypothetical protein